VKDDKRALFWKLFPSYALLGPEHIGCRMNDKIGIEPAL